MEDLIEDLTRGNVTEVKIVLTSIVTALAFYQVFLMAVGYGKVRIPFLGKGPASFAHRSIGDTIVVVAAIVALMCLGYFGFEEAEEARGAVHVAAGTLLMGAIALKIVVVRWWHRMGRFLPAIGLSIFALFVITWLSSAAEYI